MNWADCWSAYRRPSIAKYKRNWTLVLWVLVIGAFVLAFLGV